ncbi:uncharacterized protein K460DRAFT_380005 [Cucurbitaria berberidis CBS 394.84]|uniref:Uncharacterized protein n=1 Tax=Cucurbitaria berberidis CBS 394.84 TaxID=1168544 RepID=A0A9P4GAJ4_9PLEO|nr:uncharacterized protein K460DRAFT_380005 [Cucurbitaria berberidis CBS 394.84]KAF1842040.1 hypothetical protein K460DRAFT_380005 [Cucurbitaria berberidis CBS 394.84]
MRLNLKIPQKELTKDDQRTLKIRRASAERWKPKLQRPFPARREIKEAYNLKLMRHYPNQLDSTEPNFVKPHIDRSPRVDELLRQFPIPVATSISASAQTDNTNVYATPVLPTQAEIDELEKQRMLLKANRIITRSEYAQRLAWKNFSSRERNRIDRGREAMLHSGLCENDLEKESAGQHNQLPEWRKRHTGRFAREQRH